MFALCALKRATPHLVATAMRGNTELTTGTFAKTVCTAHVRQAFPEGPQVCQPHRQDWYQSTSNAQFYPRKTFSLDK